MLIWKPSRGAEKSNSISLIELRFVEFKGPGSLGKLNGRQFRYLPGKADGSGHQGPRRVSGGLILGPEPKIAPPSNQPLGFPHQPPVKTMSLCEQLPTPGPRLLVPDSWSTPCVIPFPFGVSETCRVPCFSPREPLQNDGYKDPRLGFACTLFLIPLLLNVL